MNAKTLVEARRTLVEQLPLFLQLRRRKWTGLQAFLDESHLSRPALSLLRALEGETVRGQALTLKQMREDLFNPYATQLLVFEQLSLLIERGYLQQSDEGYIVTDTGRTLTNRIEIAARAYIGSLKLPSSTSLPALAAVLVERVHNSWQAPEPLIKAHQARTQRRLPVEDEPALVQIEWAILGLWEARDDAHMAAWRAYSFSGPVFDILSRIWSGEARTLSSLTSTFRESQQPADIQQGIIELTRSGYILVADNRFELTPQGKKIRDDIEAETDRVFFALWEPMTSEEVIWLGEQLRDLCSYFRELAR